MNKRAQLQRRIADTAMNVKNEQMRLHEHQHYFAHLAQRHRLLILGSLPCALGAGWYLGKRTSGADLFKKGGEFVFLTLFNTFRKSLLGI